MPTHPHLARIADVASEALGPAPLGGARRRLGAAIGLRGVGLSHYDLAEGERPFPVHLHLEEEEVAYVLGGRGLVWLDGAVHELAAGDVLVHRPGAAAQAYVGGPGGMELLVASSPAATGLTLLPRVGVAHAHGHALDGRGALREREAALGPLDLPAPSPRPACVVRAEDCPAERCDQPGYGGTERHVARRAGSQLLGLRVTELDPGALSCPPHHHAMEEECFVVLAGTGSAWLDDDRLAIGPGSVLGRPPSTGVAHALEAGPDGLSYLAIGTGIEDDVIHYPRSQKVMIGPRTYRLEAVDYWDGELP